jgi:hypothetical protein
MATDAGAPTSMDSGLVALPAGEEESLTWTVKETVPAAVGVPLIAPVAEASARPAGRLPADTLQAYGVAPPVAESVVA